MRSDGAFAGGLIAHGRKRAHATAAGLADIIGRQNIIMASQAEALYMSAVGEAVTLVNAGKLPRERALANAVLKCANAVSVVRYVSASGRVTETSVDNAIRRHITTQASQLGGALTLDAITAYGHDLVVTDAHWGARPSHAEWQGLPACIGGEKTVDGITYPSLEDLTGYGTVTGLVSDSLKMNTVA